MVAFYTNLMTKVKILQLIKAIKSKGDVKILLGGPDITYNWEAYLDNGADSVSYTHLTLPTTSRV